MTASSGTGDNKVVLEIVGLSKSYKVGHLRRVSRPALRDLSLDVMRGEILGYLGPNGAGKTTTLKVLMGLISLDAGSITVLGMPFQNRAWRARVGYLPENPYLYDYLTAGEYLDYVGRLFGMRGPARRQRSRDLLALVGLLESTELPLRRFSKGMLQRAGIAQALMNDPDIVFFDEPMSGLDPIGRRLVRDILLDLKRQGKTIFFSTHILPDAEALCDRVALLREGRLVKVGPLDEILCLDVSHVEVLVTGVNEGLWERLPGSVRSRIAVGERFRLEVEEQALGATIGAVEAAGGRILAVQAVRQTLEDYFLKEMEAGERRSLPWLEE